MITVRDIIRRFEQRVPTQLAENWDCVGIQVADPNCLVTGVVTTLDVTPDVLDYAMEKGANLIVSHHPMLFGGLQRLDASTYQGKLLYRLIRSGVSVYSAHTNLDIVAGGLNDWATARLGLTDVRGLVARGGEAYVKLVVFVPKTHVEQVRQAVGDAGAGTIGAYSHCSFSSTGEGRFLPLEGAEPFLGAVGTEEIVEEERVECIVPKQILDTVLSAMRAAHPYEVIAYDVYPLLQPVEEYALGRIGTLPEVCSWSDFVALLTRAFPEARCRVAGPIPTHVRTVAICTGSAMEFMKDAHKQRADVYISGDMKYHEAQKACEMGQCVVDAGHFGTEHYVAEGLQSLLTSILPDTIPVSVYKGVDFIQPLE